MGETIYFDDVAVGDEGPVLAHELTRTDLVRYAGASGDFNPMHHDEIQAQAAGLPSVFGHGMYSMGLLATAITNYVGLGTLRAYQVRFVKQTWPGETFRTRVAVAGKRIEEGEHLVDLDCSLANGKGEVKVQGTATVALPVRG